MAVAFSAASESHTGTTASQSQASFSWTHTQTGTPSHVWVCVMAFGSGSEASSVTYGGVTLDYVNQVGQTGGGGVYNSVIYIFASNSTWSLPSGNQTVVVNRTNSTVRFYAVAGTVTATYPVETLSGNGNIFISTGGATLFSVLMDDGSRGENSMRFAGAVTGYATVQNADPAHSTNIHNIDIGQDTGVVVRETTPGQGPRNVGWNSTQGDGWSMITWLCVERRRRITLIT